MAQRKINKRLGEEALDVIAEHYPNTNRIIQSKITKAYRKGVRDERKRGEKLVIEARIVALEWARTKARDMKGHHHCHEEHQCVLCIAQSGALNALRTQIATSKSELEGGS